MIIAITISMLILKNGYSESAHNANGGDGFHHRHHHYCDDDDDPHHNDDDDDDVDDPQVFRVHPEFKGRR